MKQKLIALVVSKPARWLLPIAILAFGLTSTFLQTRIQHPTYTATARIWVPVKFFSMPREVDSAMTTSESALTSGPNALRTACEIIHSDAVTKLAFEDAQKKLGADCPSVDAIQSGVRAHPVESTDILELSYVGPNSDSTLSILQSVIDAFFKENNYQVTEPLQERKKRLEQQLTVAKEQYSKVKGQVKSFQDSTSFIDMQSDVNQLSQQKQELERNLEESKRDLNAVKGRLEYAQKQLGFGPESVVSVQKLAEDEIMRSLRTHIADTEVQLIGLRSKYQDEHPKVKRLKASLEEARKGLDARYMQIVGKPGLQDVVLSNSSLSGAGPSSSSTSSSGGSDGASKGVGGGISENAQARMISEMAESSTTIASLNAKIASLSSSLGQVHSKLSTVPARQVELADIHRADDLATNSLTSIERELQKIKLSETAGLSSNTAMQIIDDPTISNTSTPNTFMFGAVVSFAAAAAAVILQFILVPKTIAANRLSQLFPVRIAGLIPPAEKSRSSARSIMSSVDRVRLSLSDWLGADKLPIVITSACKNDGKSTTAYALASCLADGGMNVLLVDADTLNPSIHRMASISASPGLLQYIDEPTAEPFEYMQAVRENLTVIPAGGVSEHSCLNEPRLKKLVSELSKHFDAIVFDSPDCGESLDSLTAPQFGCRWLAVVRLQHTLNKSLQNLAAQLEMMPMDAAAVINGVVQKDIAILRQSNRGGNSIAIATSRSETSDVASSDESEAAVW